MYSKLLLRFSLALTSKFTWLWIKLSIKNTTQVDNIVPFQKFNLLVLCQEWTRTFYFLRIRMTCLKPQLDQRSLSTNKVWTSNHSPKIQRSRPDMTDISCWKDQVTGVSHNLDYFAMLIPQARRTNTCDDRIYISETKTQNLIWILVWTD